MHKYKNFLLIHAYPTKNTAELHKIFHVEKYILNVGPMYTICKTLLDFHYHYKYYLEKI